MTDSSDEDDGNGEEEEGYGPIRSNKLEEYVKQETDTMYNGKKMWANDDSIELLEQQLLEVAKYVWVEAAEQTWKDERRIVQPDEIDTAFNELIQPQNLLLEAANEMKRLRWDFLDIADQSPAITVERENGEDHEYGNVTDYSE